MLAKVAEACGAVADASPADGARPAVATTSATPPSPAGSDSQARLPTMSRCMRFTSRATTGVAAPHKKRGTTRRDAHLSRPMRAGCQGPRKDGSAAVMDGSVETTGDPLATKGEPRNSFTRIFSAVRVARAWQVSVGLGPPRALASAELSAT